MKGEHPTVHKIRVHFSFLFFFFAAIQSTALSQKAKGFGFYLLIPTLTFH